VRNDGSYAKAFIGVKSGRPMEKVYTFNGNKVRKFYRYSDTGEVSKKGAKSFHANRIRYNGDKYSLTVTFAAMKNQAMRDLGLTMVRGPVSGKVYWE
jgi:hypothetical protein